ncbi:MAG: hypothetical protein ACQESK_11135 [Bacteroidota bacterium]
MKYAIYFLMLFAVAMMVLFATMIDFSNLLGDESSYGLIGFLAAFCSLIVLAILRVSQKVKQAYQAS